MTQEEIRQRQAPLIKKYKHKPEQALLTLSARGVLGDNVTCRFQNGNFFKEAGLHPASGGSGIHVWPGDMFLESLAACAGVTLNEIASLLGIKLNSAHVIAEGDLDFRGTMVLSQEAPIGFKALRLKFDIDSDAHEIQIKHLIELTEKYCVVLQTLRQTPSIEITLNEKKTLTVN